MSKIEKDQNLKIFHKSPIDHQIPRRIFYQQASLVIIVKYLMLIESQKRSTKSRVDMHLAAMHAMTYQYYISFAFAS